MPKVNKKTKDAFAKADAAVTQEHAAQVAEAMEKEDALAEQHQLDMADVETVKGKILAVQEGIGVQLKERFKLVNDVFAAVGETFEADGMSGLYIQRSVTLNNDYVMVFLIGDSDAEKLLAEDETLLEETIRIASELVFYFPSLVGNYDKQPVSPEDVPDCIQAKKGIDFFGRSFKPAKVCEPNPENIATSERTNAALKKALNPAPAPAPEGNAAPAAAAAPVDGAAPGVEPAS